MSNIGTNVLGVEILKAYKVQNQHEVVYTISYL